jgi:hypothetical protein
MMLGMLICLTVTAAHFALRYDPVFAGRYVLFLALGAGVDMLYSLLKDGRLTPPRPSTLVTTALLVLSVPARMTWWHIGTDWWWPSCSENGWWIPAPCGSIPCCSDGCS